MTTRDDGMEERLRQFAGEACPHGTYSMGIQPAARPDCEQCMVGFIRNEISLAVAARTEAAGCSASSSAAAG